MDAGVRPRGDLAAGDALIHELGWEPDAGRSAPLQEEVKRARAVGRAPRPELGGQGFGQVKLGLMHEILGTSPLAPFVFGNAAPDSGNSEILALAGTPEQKERYLHPLLAGDLKSAFSMTEPETAGSDPDAARDPRAVADGDGWVINGHKWFSSNGSIADFLIVMAVTDPEARPHQRASMFIVDADTPGRGRRARRGDDGAPVRELRPLRQPRRDPSTRTCGSAAEALLGAQGAGFLIAQQRLCPGRIHHCMRWLGVARRAFDMLCERSLYRESHGSTLAEHQTVQNWIADSAARDARPRG